MTQPTSFTPSHRLFSPAGATWATLLGSPLAGGIILALNYWRLGQKGFAWASMAVGVVATAAVFALASVLPDWMPSQALVAGQVFAAYAIARQLQGESFTRHLLNGGRKFSNWLAAGIGGLICIALVGGFIGYWLSTGLDFQSLLDGQKSVHLGHEQEVFYSRGATRETAQSLGEALLRACQ